MVDKPRDKVESLMEGFFGLCETCKDWIDKRTSKPREKVSKFREARPRISATITATICILFVGLVIVGFATPKRVLVNIDDSVHIVSTQYYTTARRVDTFLEGHDIDYVHGQDIIDIEFYKGISNNMEINIKKAITVPVTADGETKSLTTLPCTVEEVIAELGIKLGENDIIEPALDHMLQAGDSIRVRRVSMEYIVEETETDYDTYYIDDYNVTIGDTKVTQQGITGKEKRTYLAIFIDGEEASRTLYESEVLAETQDKIISRGMNILSGVPSDLQYKEVISGVRAVSYYFDGNPHGAYGLKCEYGTCAVDKNVIPLGSLLYIEGYGYAIANDVGSAIKGKTVDVYMESLDQCIYWGARRVNVYIIEYGDNKKLW